MVLAALSRILDLDTQVVIVGSGDLAAEGYLLWRSHHGGDRFRAWIGFSEALAHRVEAGADMFLMPSRFEPCGLNQMYSQRYGTLPIVRATGGLDDTVENYDAATGEGTGFKLWDLSVDSLVATVKWAVDTYRAAPGPLPRDAASRDEEALRLGRRREEVRGDLRLGGPGAARGVRATRDVDVQPVRSRRRGSRSRGTGCPARSTSASHASSTSRRSTRRS